MTAPALLAALSEATEGSRELDAGVYETLGHRVLRAPATWRNIGWKWFDPAARRWIGLPHVTTSVDDALTLLPSGIQILDLTLAWDTLPAGEHCWPAATVRWCPPGQPSSGANWHATIESAPTLPLAICKAAPVMRVRTARAAQEAGHG